jgi:hypothetical protein
VRPAAEQRGARRPAAPRERPDAEASLAPKGVRAELPGEARPLGPLEQQAGAAPQALATPDGAVIAEPLDAAEQPAASLVAEAREPQAGSQREAREAEPGGAAVGAAAAEPDARVRLQRPSPELPGAKAVSERRGPEAASEPPPEPPELPEAW